MHILHVVGARPNFMKVAPVMRALSGRPGVRQSLVHTGQHYDANMSDTFFRQLAIPEPDVNLNVGSASHAQQTAEIMSRIEAVLLERAPDKVVVYGDVNSTAAAALVCAKLLIKVVHVEAGLRSFDRTMPEEINRIVTDRLADILFTPSDDADRNLLAEGIDPGKIRKVGNVMIDSLVELLPAAEAVPRDGLNAAYALVTLHRPSNVDDSKTLKKIIATLQSISADIPIVFPVHPRTRQRLAALNTDLEGLSLLDPLPYIEFVALEKNATVVITDSGGIQEETTWLGVPCLTLRDNTERPVTVEQGTNVLVGQNGVCLGREVDAILRGEGKKGTIPPLWDGHTGERIAEALCAEVCIHDDTVLAIRS
jgi:UDP-N-acetylglucosamine 2-epimerase (non-hydrolysing)